MSRWFRFYDDAINDPKVLRMPEALRWHWIAVLCVASKNDGVLPDAQDIALSLRMTEKKTGEILEDLLQRGLLDEVGETGLAPHNWNGRQFKSDVSNERVKRYRDRHRNVTETVTVTPPETEADTEQNIAERKDSRAVAKAPRPSDSTFDEFWKAYPKRDGANPKAPAKKLFIAAVKAGSDPQAMIAGARKCAAEDREKIGTPYIPQAVKWLRDRRWEDYRPPPETTAIRPPGAPSDEELRKRYGQHGNGISPATEASCADSERSDHGEELSRPSSEFCAGVKPH